MCGIIGYTGSENAIPKITKGLSVLEYRGYDSVGIAAKTTDNGIQVRKCKGRIGVLEEQLKANPILDCGCAIGHTRWATHGGPSDANAHPHRAGSVVLVHNGIIENYKELKRSLQEKGVSFFSETDTEVAAALLNEYYIREKMPLTAIQKACADFVGSYAFGILFDAFPGEVWAVRQGSPLILAKSADGYYLASDMTALLPFTKEYYCLQEGQIAQLKPTGVALYNADGTAFTPNWRITTVTPEAAQKDGYAHFMLKEIHEQPKAVLQSVTPRIADGLPCFSVDGIPTSFWNKIKNIHIVACGSATHAGLAGGRLIEQLAKIPTASYIASEYRYHPPIAQEGTLVILISQSGETADTLAALRYAKANGLATLAIVNAVETTIAREADYRIYTYAGPEIAVATTKGYCTQVSILYMIALEIAYCKGLIDADSAKKLVGSICNDAPAAISHIIAQEKQIRKIAEKLCSHEHIFYIGRGLDYDMSLEGSLKLKEISYIHSEAYAAGELKHGTISLIEEGTPVIALSTNPALYDKTESNIREVRSRGAYVVLLCRKDAKNPHASADAVVALPAQSEAATLFAALATVQLLAYQIALLRGCDIDRPRNLAKSVTVE